MSDVAHPAPLAAPGAPMPSGTAGAATLTTLAWLHEEFPDWRFDVDRTATWEGGLRPLWIARKDGHHPQAELSPAKLHTRLTEYLAREARRHVLSN